MTKAMICICWPQFGQVNGRSARMRAGLPPASSKAQSEAWGPARWPLLFSLWFGGGACDQLGAGFGTGFVRGGGRPVVRCGQPGLARER